MSMNRHLLGEEAEAPSLEANGDIWLSPQLPEAGICCCFADLEYMRLDTAERCNKTPSSCLEWSVSLYAFLFIFLILLGASHGLVFVSLRVLNYSLSAVQIITLIVGIIFFAYVEAYKGFHKSWSPITARRCLIAGKLVDFQRSVIGSLAVITLAPLFAAGFFYASKRRLILAYGLVALIVGFILLVKQLPSPWHEVVDCGVAFGLSLGTLSFAYVYLRACWTKELPIDITAK